MRCCSLLSDKGGRGRERERERKEGEGRKEGM
jgi:hypothetical protein